MRIRIYTKTGCHLCDVMDEVINSLKDEFEFEYEKLDIEYNKTLLNKYRDKIPVLMIDGKLFAKYRVDREKLKKRLLSGFPEC